MLKFDMIGRSYPIKNLNNEIVSYKPIKFQAICENYAGVLISLTDQTSWILVNFLEANRICENPIKETK